MAEERYWLWLSLLKDLGVVGAVKYIRHFETVRRLYDATEQEYREVEQARPSEIAALGNKSLKRADEVLEKCRRQGVTILTMDDARYPACLRDIYDAPLLLYVRGELPAMDEEVGIGVVGTRRASEYGLRAAEKIAGELVRSGAIVVTGLADGADSAGAKAALRAGGRVVGVLGTGIDGCYPAWNLSLQRAVEKNGALVSEYPPGAKGHPGNFPARNRIISGLAKGVLVVEAPIKSGALITAARAAEQGRDLFAVPGNIDLPGFAGSNALIRDGAALATCGWDILSEYSWKYLDKIRPPIDEKRKKPTEMAVPAQRKSNPSQKKEVDNNKTLEYIDLKEQLKELGEDEVALVLALSSGRLHTDELIRATGLETSRVLTALTLLELKGYIRDAGGHRFELVLSPA